MVTEPEEIREALERMDIPVTDQTTIEDFQEALADVLRYEPSALQLRAYWSKGVQAQEQLAELGIRQVQFVQRGRTITRWAWKEAPGLWSWETIAEYYGFG